MITAHSGCENTRMNSQEYLKKAIAIHPDALEVDIRSSEKGLILDHDGRKYADTILLGDALGAISATDIRLNADLKEKGLEQAVAEQASELGISSERIIFTGCIGDPEGMLSHIGQAAVFANPEEFDALFYHHLEENKGEQKNRYVQAVFHSIHQCGFSVINIDYRFLDNDLFQICRDIGLLLSLWTLDNIEEAVRILNSRAQDLIINITTNHPATMKVLLEKA